MIDEESSASGQDYASDRSAIGAGPSDEGTPEAQMVVWAILLHQFVVYH